MANLYVRSTDGSNADNGSTWALAKATLNGALAVAVAGDTIYVSQVHAETQATNLTITPPTGAGVKIICANDAAEPPTTRADTATVSVTSSSGIIFDRGIAYVRGITFGTQSGNFNQSFQWSSSLTSVWVHEDCNFNLLTTNGAASKFIFGGNSQNQGTTRWVNCNIKRNATASAMTFNGGRFEWLGGAVQTTTNLPTVISGGATGSNMEKSVVHIEGVDFSALGSSLVLVDATQSLNIDVTFQDCKLPASATLSSGAFTTPGGVRCHMINCDSADTQYRFARARFEGSEVSETIIVRTGGASDGTTPFSRKVVSGSGTTWMVPYRSMPIEIWNDTVGSPVTITVPVVTDNVTLTDTEAWVEVEYLGTSGVPLGSYLSDRLTDPVFGTPASQATDGSSVWTTTGLTTPVKQSLSVAVTPQEKGIIRATVVLAKASTTMYYDPMVVTP